MATSIKELEKQAKREQFAKEFSKVYSVKNENSDTRKKYDVTPFHKKIFISE